MNSQIFFLHRGRSGFVMGGGDNKGCEVTEQQGMLHTLPPQVSWLCLLLVTGLQFLTPQKSFLWWLNKKSQRSRFVMPMSLQIMPSCYWETSKPKPWKVTQSKDSLRKGECTILLTPIPKALPSRWDTVTAQNSRWSLFVILLVNSHLTPFPLLISVRVPMKLLTAGRQLVGHDYCLWHQ